MIYSPCRFCERRDQPKEECADTCSILAEVQRGQLTAGPGVPSAEFCDGDFYSVNTRQLGMEG